jgi:hypothetical protein
MIIQQPHFSFDEVTSSCNQQHSNNDSTPTAAVKKVVIEIQRVLDQSLLDAIQETQDKTNIDDEAGGDDSSVVSINNELGQLSAWQDKLQSELEQVEGSWRREKQADITNTSCDTISNDTSRSKGSFLVVASSPQICQTKTTLVELIRSLSFQSMLFLEDNTCEGE